MTAEARTALSEELLALARTAATAAGELLLERFALPATGVGTKSTPTDLVSDADRDAEKLIERIILGSRPDDAITGEEGLAASGSSGIAWLVDPLDGTVNFLYGIPHWCVSVGCSDGEGPLAGAIFDPTRGELFHGRVGGGAWLGTRRLAVSKCTAVSEALMATGFAYDPKMRARQAELAMLLPGAVRDIRRSGSAALDMAYCAAGRLDAYFETGVSPWDVAAGTVLVTEAGGLATRLEGLGLDQRPGMVASNRAIHVDLLAFLTASGDRVEAAAGRSDT